MLYILREGSLSIHTNCIIVLCLRYAIFNDMLANDASFEEMGDNESYKQKMT